MIEWASKHSDLLQVAMGVLTAVVWMFYLHLIHSDLRRRRRSYVLINAGGSCGFSGTCFVVNIGLEPVYVSDVVLAFELRGERHEARLTDRAELRWEDLTTAADATVEGPLGSNEQIAIGTFDQLIHRAALVSPVTLETDEIAMVERLEVTAILNTAAGSGMVAARRDFAVTGPEHARLIVPASIGTRQIRSGRERRKLEAEITDWTRCRPPQTG